MPTLSVGHSESHSCDTSTSRYVRAKEREATDASWSLRRQRAQSTPKRVMKDQLVKVLENANSSSTSISVQTMLGQDDIVRF